MLYKRVDPHRISDLPDRCQHSTCTSATCFCPPPSFRDPAGRCTTPGRPAPRPAAAHAPVTKAKPKQLIPAVHVDAVPHLAAVKAKPKAQPKPPTGAQPPYAEDNVVVPVIHQDKSQLDDDAVLRLPAVKAKPKALVKAKPQKAVIKPVVEAKPVAPCYNYRFVRVSDSSTIRIDRLTDLLGRNRSFPLLAVLQLISK